MQKLFNTPGSLYRRCKDSTAAVKIHLFVFRVQVHLFVISVIVLIHIHLVLQILFNTKL